MTRTVLAVLVLAAAPARAAGPVGAVTVDCERVEGWAQDPDDPAAAIPVHLYFDGPAGDPAATAIAVTANLSLQSGCDGDQCAHGFRATLPLSRHDGAPHPVHAYGIDTVDPNLELSLSPAVYTCAPLPITAGVKRHIINPDILNAWKFSIFFDMMKIADVDLAAAPVGPPVDVPPQLAVAEGTTEPLWLVDQGHRRAVAPEVAPAWRLDPAAAVPMPADMLAALPEGTPLAARPILVQGTGPAVYLLDDRQCAADDPDPACAEPDDSSTGTTDDPGDESSTGEPADPTTTSSSGPDDPTTGDASATGDTSGASSTDAATGDPGSDDAGGCGCRHAPSHGAWLLLLAFARRRRR